MPADVNSFTSRRTLSMGKADARLETVLPEEVLDMVAALACLERKSKSEWLRDLVMREVLGAFQLIRVRIGASDSEPEDSR